MVRRYRNGWWLQEKYVEEGWTQREIAEECGVSATTIRKYMRRFDVPTRDVEGEAHGLYGRERDPAVRERISESLAGRSFTEETLERMSEVHEGNTPSEETKRKISDSLSGLERPPSTRRKMSESRMGPKNPSWKGGHSSNYGPGWTGARREVRDRDVVCRHCGHDGSDSRLEVHHVVPVWKFQEADDASLEDAHVLSNLVLLCRSCHAKAEKGEITFESEVDDPLG